MPVVLTQEGTSGSDVTGRMPPGDSSECEYGSTHPPPDRRGDLHLESGQVRKREFMTLIETDGDPQASRDDRRPGSPVGGLFIVGARRGATGR